MREPCGGTSPIFGRCTPIIDEGRGEERVLSIESVGAVPA